MRKAWKYFFFLLWLSYLFVCGILLFTRGFLLSRRTLTQKSSCTENSDCSIYQKLSKEEPSFENTQRYLHCLDKNQLKLQENSNNRCLESKKKVVLLVIDALRYDFAVYNHSLKQEEVLPYQNKLKIIDELLTTLPNNSLLFKFIANPPTTTMQRLKGLTTGSLPTFIDVGSNFATPEIDEDNILDQIIAQEKKIVFMGDDTWTTLYPGRFIRQYSYPSFNVWDLDTVDNGIIAHLKPELQKSDWNLLIAHFLGVDHCGHKYGPFHPEMVRKLNQMNKIIQDVVDTIDDNTILFVLGDHGMTATGDHGGESSEEVTSALFVYSPVPLLSENISVKTDSVYQVDLVPTLSAILGFAIPFSNLGKVILSVLPTNQDPNLSSSESEVQYSLNVLSINIEQIMLYINTYSRQTHAFSKTKISSLLDKFHSLKWKLNTVNDNKSFKVFHESALEFLNYVRELCEEVWVQFDSFSMSRGLVLTFLLLAFTFFIIEGIPCSHLNSVLDGAFLWIAYSIVILCIVTSAILYQYKMVDDMYLLIYVSTLSISMFIMAVVVVQNWEEITMLWFNTSKTRDWLDVFTRFIHLCSLLMLFSNSFIIEEGTVLTFFVCTIVWLSVYYVNVQKNEPNNTKTNEKSFWFLKILNNSKFRHFLLTVMFTFFLRGSHYFWRCREEQKWCIVATDSLKSYSSFKSGKGNIDSIITLAFLALFVSLVRIWLRSCGNLVGFSPTVVLVRYAPSVIIVCLGGFWVLQGLPNETRNKLFVPWQLQILPWTVFGLISLTLICLFIQPLCVYVMEKKTDVVSVYGNENIIPQLFHQVKKVIKNSNDEDNGIRNKSPLVYGLATAYSAVFIILLEFVSLFAITLLGDALAFSVVLMFAALVILLLIYAFARLESTLVTAQLFHVPWSFVLSWGLLASYFFYGTGHQPTFPGIHWYAAFVGTGGQFTNNFIPAFLIGANTFCSFIITGLALPALLIAPFTFPVMLPKWLSSTTSQIDKYAKKQPRQELREGDICLYEKEGLTEYALLKLSAKYIIYQGTRIFACMLSAAIHCRHLMVWMIFTPRFIFEAIGFMVTLGSVLTGFLLVMRITTKIDHLMNILLKKHDL